MANPLTLIKPKYPHLVNYSKSEEPLQTMPDSQHLNESIFSDSQPTRMIKKEEDVEWAQALREAANAM